MLGHATVKGLARRSVSRALLYSAALMGFSSSSSCAALIRVLARSSSIANLIQLICRDRNVSRASGVLC